MTLAEMESEIRQGASWAQGAVAAVQEELVATKALVQVVFDFSLSTVRLQTEKNC